jgi:hypothetical protein
MRRLVLAAAAALLSIATFASAQVPAPADSALRVAGQAPRPVTDSLFRRARRLVADGNGGAGRALVDSLLRVADPASPAYGDALYWHGALAPTAAEAERDYRRVIVEYPLAYYADDALLAIAELEQARGDRAGALMHLQRFVREHPSSAGRGVAALGAARLAFEQRDTKLGCSMIATARASASSTDVELRNQIEYYGRQCSGDAVAASVPPTSASPVAAAAPPRPTQSAAAAPTPKVSTPRTPPQRTPPQRTPPPPISTMPTPVTPVPRPSASTTTRSTTPAPRRSESAPARRDSAPAKASAPAIRAPAAAPGRMFTVQLAAYDTRPPAEQLARKLATRGVKARVSGTAKPFRVRLDFYRTRREASAVVASLKARGIIGFVAEEVPPTGVRSP